MDWQPAPGTTPTSGSSFISGSGGSSIRSNLRVNYGGITASLQAAVPRLISTMGNCKPSGETEALLICICDVLTAILDSNPNASGAISKLDQLAIFAQLQNIPHSSPTLLPVLKLAHHIVKVRDDSANLHGELAMCVPQIISVACSSALSIDAQTLALDFICHISSDGQHAATLVEAGIVRPLVQLLGQPRRAPGNSASSPQVLALQIIANLLGTIHAELTESFAGVCASVIASGGTGVIKRFVVASGDSDIELACEWAVNVLSEISRDGGGRESIIAENALQTLAGVGMQSGVNERIVEGVLATISQFCGNAQYQSALRESHAIGTVAIHLLSADNVVSLISRHCLIELHFDQSWVSIALKCVLQLAKEPGGRELLKVHGIAAQLEALSRSTTANPTLPNAARKVLTLLQA